MHRGSLAAGALLLAVLAACAGDAPGPSADAPSQFTDRTPLPACSPVELGLHEPLPSSAQACLDRGHVDGRGAELSVEHPSVDSPPSVTWYRAVPGSPGYELFTDATEQAAMGSGAWEYRSCPHAVSVTDLGECTYSELT